MKNLHLLTGAGRTSCSLIVAFCFIGCGQTGQVSQENANQEEVSVGYGTLPRQNVTSAVSRIEARGEMRPWRSVEEMLERVSGVRLLRGPRGGIRVLIRGVNSIHGSNQPLYVVDGMPVHVEAGQGLYWLDPTEVKTIEVLKDAGATAIFGQRGANGVIIITTKH